MARVKRIHRRAIYFIAIFISGLFSLMGRSSPLWAEEVKGSQNSKIFNEMYRDDKMNKTDWREVPSANKSKYITDERMPTNSDPIREHLQSIRAKMDNGGTLSAEEAAILVGVENRQKIEELSNQLNLLMKMIKNDSH